MQNLKAHFQISSIANPSMTARCSHGHLLMTCRWPGGDRTISCRPTATGRRPGSHRPGTCRSPSGHRPKVMSPAEKIGRSPNSHPAVAGRRLCLTFYDMVQGRENPAMIRRCLKTGISGKSAGHRTIYKACNVGLTNHSLHSLVNQYRLTVSIYICFSSSLRLRCSLSSLALLCQFSHIFYHFPHIAYSFSAHCSFPSCILLIHFPHTILSLLLLSTHYSLTSHLLLSVPTHCSLISHLLLSVPTHCSLTSHLLLSVSTHCSLISHPMLSLPTHCSFTLCILLSHFLYIAF